MEQESYLIVGLGNPGREHAGNRHNVGFRCLHRLAAAHDLAFTRRQRRARVAVGMACGRRVVLALPQTFMNESGRSVAALVQFHKVDLDRLLVVCDDLDLPTGALRLRPGGGSGGHKGMQSIIRNLGNQGFARLRVGIDRPPGRMDPADYVLQDFSATEEPLVAEVTGRAVAAMETWLLKGVAEAMNLHNQGPPEAPEPQ